MSCCDSCGRGECRYVEGYEEGRAAALRDQPDLMKWAFKNRHSLTSTEYDLLERVADLLERDARL